MRLSPHQDSASQKFPPFNTPFIVWRAAAAAYRALVLLGDTAKGDTAGLYLEHLGLLACAARALRLQTPVRASHRPTS